MNSISEILEDIKERLFSYIVAVDYYPNRIEIKFSKFIIDMEKESMDSDRHFIIEAIIRLNEKEMIGNYGWGEDYISLSFAPGRITRVRTVLFELYDKKISSEVFSKLGS